MKLKDRLVVVTNAWRTSRHRNLLLAGGVALGLALAALAYVALSGGSGTGPGAGKGEMVDGVVQDGSGKTVTYWFDPMLPAERYNAPGKSSMGMDLQPKYADEAATGGVRVSPEVQQNLGVRTTRVVFANLGASLAAVGKVETDERRIFEVQTLTPGFVEQLTVRAVGEPVGRGKLIATVYSPELYGAQLEYAALRKIGTSAITPGLRQAARQRLRLLGLPAAAIQTLDRGGAPQRTYGVFARQSGIVTAIGARPGARVEPGQSIATLADLSQVWVIAEVPEASLGQIRVGQPVEIAFPAYPGDIRRGRIDYIFPTLDPEARTARVRATLANPGGRLKIGMFANLKIDAPASGGLVVPTEAVISTGRRNVVIVQRNQGFVPVEVELGRTFGEQTEIRTGLRLNEVVVVSGQFLIDSEASLTGVVERLSRGQQATAQQLSVQGKGIVKSIDLSAGRIILAHEPVLHWPAMTMPFAVRDRALLRGRKVGERVMFEFQRPPPGQPPVIERIAPDTAR
jgi:Cu(I)/Ag(I) efflux system membrane fusion protein